MKKKIITIVASSLGVIVTSALLAAGIFMLVRNKNVEETGNVLGVSWYNEAEEEFEITTAEQLNDDQRRRYGSIILEQAIRLSTLSKNMMQLTLLEVDDLVLDIKKYSLIAQLQRVIDMQQGLASENQIDIVSNFPKGDVYIQADEDRMEQVFINLINNAVKYTQAEGVVTINVKKNLKDIEISIEDTGIGMNKEALQHIYDRFYRADKSRSIRGNGLGLSIVKRIVDLHHFKIGVESQVDVGTVFKITIPQDLGRRGSKRD